MSQPVLIRSSTRNWDFALLVALFVLLLVGSVAAIVAWNAKEGIFSAAISGVLLLIVALAWWNRARRRQWAQDTGSGFLLIDGRGERNVADADVLSMALHYRQNHSQGIVTSVTRRFLVWLATDADLPECVPMTTQLAPGKSDPLEPLVQRVGERLFAMAQQDLQAGRAVLGQGWSLQRNRLTLQLGRETLESPLEEVTACSWMAQKLCLWRQGDNAVWAKVPAEYANAYLLGRLVGDHLERRPARETPAADGDLGRIIFERKARTIYSLACLFLAALLVLVAGSFVVAAFAENVGFAAAALAFLAASAAAVMGWLHLRKSLFRCHQYGVYKSGLFGERSLRYADMEAFTFSATRVFVHGAYSGTNVQMAFEPAPHSHAGRISYFASVRHLDQELDELRDGVARTIAARMAERFNAHQPVPWTKHMRLVPEGLEHQPSGFLGRKPPVVLPFGDIYSYQIEKGWFSLWRRNQKKPVIQEAVNQRNFFPGYFLLATIVPLTPPQGSSS